VTDVLTRSVAALLAAPIAVVAVAVLVKGYSSAGDGFSAGAIGALGLALQYVVFGKEEVLRWLPVNLIRPAALVALLLALAVAAVPLALGDQVLTHYPAPGDDVVTVGKLELITAVLYDTAIFGLVLGTTAGILGVIARAGEGDALAAEDSPVRRMAEEEDPA
jgi:multisubunit Na+/H+ antiporter MnhB subunit